MQMLAYASFTTITTRLPLGSAFVALSWSFDSILRLILIYRTLDYTQSKVKVFLLLVSSVQTLTQFSFFPLGKTLHIRISVRSFCRVLKRVIRMSHSNNIYTVNGNGTISELGKSRPTQVEKRLYSIANNVSEREKRKVLKRKTAQPKIINK